MAINYAEKYSDKVDERFTQASLTQAAFNQDYDWEGVSTINIYSLATAPMNDYQMTGDNRYGTPDELGDTTQTMTLTQDRSFTFTVDRRNYEDTMMVREVGKALNRQITEQVVPEVDIYRIGVLEAGAGLNGTGAITKDNAYAYFLDGVAGIKDNKAPLAGTFAFIGTNFYKMIRQDSGFIKNGDLSQEMLVNGMVGMVEGIPLIYVPMGYMTTGTEFIITNKVAAVSAQKLSEYKTHDNPPGINGWLCEGRVYHDAFILNNKKNAIYVHKAG